MGLRQELATSHGVINLLHSQLQGWFAYEKVLQERQHPKADPEIHVHITHFLNMVLAWREVLIETGEPFIDDQGKCASPEALDSGLSVLEALFERLISLGGTVREITQAATPLEERLQDQVFLVAGLAWWYYGQEHDCKGDVLFGETFNDPDLVQKAQDDLKIIGDFVGWTNWLFRFTDPAQERPDTFMSTLEQMLDPIANGQLKAKLVYMGNILKSFGRDPWGGEKLN